MLLEFKYWIGFWKFKILGFFDVDPELDTLGGTMPASSAQVKLNVI